ncbi:cytochrome c [Pantoea sp. KPR_PJ]|uniref:c-type cytochrome n=1 Tax=Pantoea sp. KPR_PJ TaxID=2738375 RepID=UPI003527120E
MKITLVNFLPSLALFFSFAAAAETASPEMLEQGKYIATAGDCVACHSIAGKAPFTGGLKMMTPVGAIYSTNITPDKETGIGEYSYDDFARALREGVAKDGHHLYPAMPYTAYAKINDDDMHALYAYIMQGVKAVHQENRKSDIPWPLNMRWPLALWNTAFHDDKPYVADATQSAEWNRGAYLVQGLGHCGTCHTPRGIGYQEKSLDQHGEHFLTGGTLEGWHAPDLTGNNKTGLGGWSAEEIALFLKTGRTDKSAAFGSMTDVIEHSTQYLSDADLTAVATYLKSLHPAAADVATTPPVDATTAALIKGDISTPGSRLYMDNCSGCHRLDGKGYAKTFPSLAGNSAVLSDDPSSVISIILRGGKMAVTRDAVTGLAMPDFAWRLSDADVADLATFIRNSWGNKAPAVKAEEVKELRKALPTPTEKDQE